MRDAVSREVLEAVGPAAPARRDRDDAAPARQRLHLGQFVQDDQSLRAFADLVVPHPQARFDLDVAVTCQELTLLARQIVDHGAT